MGQKQSTIIATGGITNLTKESPLTTFVTGTNSHTIILPSIAGLPNSYNTVIVNNSTHGIIIKNSELAILKSIPSKSRVDFTLLDTKINGGTWSTLETMTERSVINMTESGSIPSWNSIITVSPSDEDIKLTLPPMNIGTIGQSIILKKIGSSTSVITISPTLNQTINETTSIELVNSLNIYSVNNNASISA